MGNLTNSWALIKASWGVLRQDKEILIFPFLSGVSSLLIFGCFAFFLNKTGFPEMMKAAEQSGQLSEVFSLQYYGYLFVFYLVNYFSITFFSVALISCACIRMSGHDPDVLDGFVYAFKRIKFILGWAILEATVGVFLNMLQDRSKGIGKWLVGFIGFSWALASYLVVPVFIVEEIGPLAALKKSTELFKKTWGEQIAGSFMFGAISFLFYIPGVILFAVSFFFFPRNGGSVTANSVPLPVLGCIAAAVFYFIVLAIVSGALKGVFQAALYQFASEGVSPKGFRADELSGSFSPAN